MGRASRSKRARREERAKRQELEAVVGAVKRLGEWIEDRAQRLEEATALWWDGDPAPVRLPQWPDDSLAGRLFSDPLFRRVLDVPPLERAKLPDPAVIAAGPAQWEVAAWVLVRAVVLDGREVDDPVVTSLVGALAAASRAELAACEAAATEARRDGLPPGAVAPEGFDGDGPVFVIGCCALVQATWALIGEDPLHEVLDLLAPCLDGALPGRGDVIAGALLVAFSDHYSCEQEADLELLGRLRDETSGNPLQDLVSAGVVLAEDALRVGLEVLGRLAGLCMSEAASVLDRPSAAVG